MISSITAIIRSVYCITLVSTLLLSLRSNRFYSSAVHSMSSNIASFQYKSLSYDDISKLARDIVPPLTYDDHKGSMGRVGVIGGSRDYTGAPYYAASSSLKFGGDLAFVFCSKQAAGPIKTYSPELMVVPFYDDEFVDSMKSYKYSSSVDEKEICTIPDHIVDTLSRIHTLVIGPGLGRNPMVLNSVRDIIRLAKSRNIGLVIDADGLWLLNSDPSIIAGYQRCILTPNQAEFTRLLSSVQSLYANDTADALLRNNKHLHLEPSVLAAELSSAVPVRQARALSQALGGITLLVKGQADLVTSGGVVYELGSELQQDGKRLVLGGSPRRCGGQGDILAGSLGTALHWALKRKELLKPLSALTPGDAEAENIVREVSDGDACMYAAMLASTVTKAASALAFKEMGRAMTAPDVLQQVGRAFATVVPE